MEKDTYSVHVHILILNFFETVLGENLKEKYPCFFLIISILFLYEIVIGFSEIDLKLGAK